VINKQISLLLGFLKCDELRITHSHLFTFIIISFFKAIEVNNYEAEVILFVNSSILSLKSSSSLIRSFIFLIV